MKKLLLIIALFETSFAYSQAHKTDTLKVQLSEDVIKLLTELEKEGTELQKDAQWILINTKLQAVQAKQLALITGFQQGKEIKGTLVGLKEGKLLIVNK